MDSCCKDSANRAECETKHEVFVSIAEVPPIFDRRSKIVQGERIAKQNTKFFAFYSEPKPIFATSRKNSAR